MASGNVGCVHAWPFTRECHRLAIAASVCTSFITKNCTNFQNTSAPPQEHTEQLSSLMAGRLPMVAIRHCRWPVGYCWWPVDHTSPKLLFLLQQRTNRGKTVYSQGLCVLLLSLSLHKLKGV